MCKRNVAVTVAKKYDRTAVNSKWIQVELQKLNVNVRNLWDSYYMALSPEDWAEAMLDVAKNMPAYTAEVFDCDNFALLTAGRTMERYQTNGIGIAIGESPWGAHVWNILVSWENGEGDEPGVARLTCYEPQTGQFFELNTEGYTLDAVIWG